MCGGLARRVVIMRVCTVWLILPLLSLVAGLAHGQLPGSSVQLPTFSYFNTSSTVLVPDRGSAFMGGVGRASSGRNEFGTPLSPLRNVGIGSERSASNVHVSVTIHDFDAMDEYLLGQAAGRQDISMAALRTTFQTETADIRRASASSRGGIPGVWEVAPPRSSLAPQSLVSSVAEERLRRTRQQQTRQSEATEYFHRGQKAEAAGKKGAAKVFYQMAARRATGQLKQQLSVKLEAISRKQAGSAVVDNH
jgi:hypothetical protein